MNSPIRKFLLRWFVSGLGLWIAAAVLSDKIDYGGRAEVIIIAGLVLAIVNTLVKPLVIVLSLPAILLTLGLFILVINGLMVMLVSALYAPLHIDGFLAALLTSVIIGFVNYLVTAIIEDL